MKQLNRKLWETLSSKAEEGQTYAYGGGLLVTVLIVVLLVLLLR